MGRKMGQVHSPTKLKILTLLQAGLSLGLSPSPRHHWYVINQVPKEFNKIDRHYLYQLIREFKEERLVDYRENRDGTISMTLTERGQQIKLKYDIDNLQLKTPKSWDKIWRVVFFDVPEKKRMIRDALRKKLKELGFYEMQKSVWVHPYPCAKEINFVIEFFDARRYVQLAELHKPTNEAQLKLHFNLT